MATAAYLAFEPADEDAARAVSAELERNGWTVVMSGPQLRAAEAPGALAQAIADTCVVVVLASRAGHDSSLLRREAAAALNNGRPIVVVQSGELPPGSWMHATLDLSAAVDLRSGARSEALAQIVEKARAAVGRGRVIAMVNIKGGVGKTVLAANLFAAAHLADGRAISFVDLDPQHNLTQYFLASAERNRLREGNLTIYGILSRGDAAAPQFGEMAVPLSRARRETAPVFDLITGDERLFEFALGARSDNEKALAFTRFRALVAALRARSDAVVIDTNPSATFLTSLAVAAADHIVVPVRPEKYALTGLNMLEHLVREIRGRALHPADFSVLLNGVNDRTRFGETGDADALTRAGIGQAPFFGSALLPVEVPYTAALKTPPNDRAAANPITATALMRVGGRVAKEALTRAAAAIVRRAMP